MPTTQSRSPRHPEAKTPPMPPAPKAAIVPSDTIEIDNTVIRCQKSRSLIDANDIFSMITNTTSSAERLVWSKFKLTDPGVYRVKWDKACGGLGRISVRVDLMSQQLRQIKHGKCDTALQIAEKLDAEFPNSNGVSEEQLIAQHGVDQSMPVRKKRCSPNTNDMVTGCKQLVTIYKIVYIPENRAVYTGRTKDPENRMKQHASKSSKTRLIRNAIRRHGLSKFVMEPIVRCSTEDADANESYYIQANGTMHPHGYNLRHGSRAGVEHTDATVLSTTGLVEWQSTSDELMAKSEVFSEIAKICEGLEHESESTDSLCIRLLRDVHPDKAHGRAYSAGEVSAMLNSVRQNIAEGSHTSPS